jgi:hypothetical protein
MEEKSELTIKVDEKEEIEIFVSIIILGLCTALKEDVLGIEDAESYLYNPYSMERLKKLAVNQELIDIVHLGTELEDVKSLLPGELTASIEEIEEKTLQFIQALANRLPNAPPRKKWIRN